MRHFEGVVRDRKIQVGPARHEEHARLDRLQGANKIAVVEFVGADVGVKPGRSLSVEFLRLSAREPWLPEIVEEIIEIYGAGARQVKARAILVLAHRPARIDPRESAQGFRWRCREAAPAGMLRGRLERRQERSQEDLIVNRRASAAAYDDCAFDLVGKESRPVIGLLRAHRETIYASDPVDSKNLPQETLLRPNIVG